MTKTELRAVQKMLFDQATEERSLVKAMVKQRLYAAAAMHEASALSFLKLANSGLEYTLRAHGVRVEQEVPAYMTKKKTRAAR